MKFVLSSRFDRGLLPLILASLPAEAGEISGDPTRLLSYLEAQLGLLLPEKAEGLCADGWNPFMAWLTRLRAVISA